jgi:hypothetical protein
MESISLKFDSRWVELIGKRCYYKNLLQWPFFFHQEKERRNKKKKENAQHHSECTTSHAEDWGGIRR